MSRLAITLIDVGWGDSILLEAEDDSGSRSFAVVDSNDSTQSRSSFLFLKRHFERRKIPFSSKTLLLDFILATHGHADHVSGLKGIMKAFGVKRFIYPASLTHPSMTNIVRFANRSSQVAHHTVIDNMTVPFSFGPVRVEVLWPPAGYSSSNENHFSVVLALALGSVTFVLTGDAEAVVWPHIVGSLPASTRLFQVPHHGAHNGLFEPSGGTPWLNYFTNPGTKVPQMVMSSHIVPHAHPDPAVTAALDRHSITYNRTDEHYHITFETDGALVSRKFYQ